VVVDQHDAANLTIFIPITDLEITGKATDDHGVDHIELNYVNKITNAIALTETAETCTGCPNAPVTWAASPSSLAPGIYDVSAYAIDVVGNRSQAATITIVVV